MISYRRQYNIVMLFDLVGVLGGSTVTVNSLENFKVHDTSLIETQGFGSSEISYQRVSSHFIQRQYVFCNLNNVILVISSIL